MDVFINFDPHDRALVDKLDRALQSLGVCVAFDQRHFVSQDRRQALDETADLSLAVLTIWSQASVASKEVIRQAHRAGVNLIQLSAGASVRPKAFRGTRAVNLAHWTGDLGDPALASLLKRIGRASCCNDLVQKARSRARGQSHDVVALLRMILIEAARAGSRPFSISQLSYLLSITSAVFGVDVIVDADLVMGALAALNEQNRLWSEPPLMVLLDKTADYSAESFGQDQLLPPGIAPAVAQALHLEYLRKVREYNWRLDD